MALEKIKKETNHVKREFRERTFGYVTAGLGFVAGLAWNDAIAALIAHLFPVDKNSLVAKFTYAVLVTIVVVILATYLAHIFHREKKNR